MKRIHTFLQTVLDGRLEFRERIVRLVLLLAFAASIIGMGAVMLGAAPDVLIAFILMCAVSGLALWLAVEHRKTKEASWLLIIVFNIALFPAVFLMSGGMESGAPVWFVLELVYIFLMFTGKDFFIAFSLSVVSFLATYFVSYRFPDFMSVPVSRFYSFADSYVTIIIVSCFIGILLKVQTMTYDKERKLAEQQKEEIEQIAHSKDAFFANMSHEIRTPINTIIGLNEMILREDISDEIAENAINIQNASKMLLTLLFW